MKVLKSEHYNATVYTRCQDRAIPSISSTPVTLFAHHSFQPQSVSLSMADQKHMNYSQITAEAAHRSHPAPQAIPCCLEEKKREEKMKLTVRFYSRLTLIHQQTKSIQLDRVQKLQRDRESKGKPEAEECCHDLKQAWILS